MIEIYLFIHPLCPESLKSEKKILDLISNEQKKIQFRFIPLINLYSFQAHIEKYDIYLDSMEERNNWFEASYAVTLDYKAIQLQGKKKGRQFLFAIQEETCIQRQPYSLRLVDKIITSIGGDLAMFHADRHSDIVIDSYHSDQLMAKEMNVTQCDSAVVFNYTSDRDYGVLIEDYRNKNIIRELLKSSSTNCPSPNIYEMRYGGEHYTVDRYQLSQKRLHLLK